MKSYSEFISEKKSPYKEETLQKYKKEYEEGKDIPFGVRTSLIAQGMIPHEGGPDKGKKKKTDLYEAQIGVPGKDINVDMIRFGNQPSDYFVTSQKSDDKIKNWFIEKGLIDEIGNGCPLNSSEETRKELISMLDIVKNVTTEEIAFCRYFEDFNNVAQSFIDLLKEDGIEESMENFFKIDNQTESLLFFLKDSINRPRPYQLAYYYHIPLHPIVHTDAGTASYPGGHALSSFVMSEYYSQKYKTSEKRLKDLAEKIAASRVNAGLHYPSDTEISRKICSIIIDNNLLSE